MYIGLILNGIRTVKPINIGLLKCFEALLKCDYSACKRHLHGTFIDILLGGELATYELIEKTKEKCLVRIYAKNDGIIKKVRDKLAEILDKDFTSIGEKHPSYLATEVFFDLLVDVAFKKSSFKYIKGKGKVLDPSDNRKYVRKRTIIEVKRDNSGNEKYYGILFIDYGMISRSSLTEKLLEELEIDDFIALKENGKLRDKSIELASSYIGKSVLTIVKRRGGYEYVYGEITGIEPVFSYEKKLPNGQTIYDIWIKRFKEDEEVKLFAETEPSKWEFPLFKVRVKGYREELTYPPSMLRLFEAVERPEPTTRWDDIRRIMRIAEDSMKKIYRDLTGKQLEFRYIKYAIDSEHVGIKPNFYTGSDTEKPFREYTVRLKYKDIKGKEKRSLASPVYVFSKGGMPYAGRQELKLLMVYPSIINDVELRKFTDLLLSLFEELNFGSIKSYKYYSYDYAPMNLSESLTSLEETLQKALPSHTSLEHLPLIVIPDNEAFYKLSKEVASNNGFHSQLVRLETFNRVIEYISKIENRSTPQEIRKRVEEALRSLIINVCGGIYAEFLIQKSVAKGKISGPLTWILANPADKSGQSMYVGLDVSTKRGVTGAAFILLDPYGQLIDARIIQLKSEVLRYQDYYDILRYMVSKAREQKLKRIVILRDGVPRTPLELEDCSKAYDKVTKELEYGVALDYVAVIKNTNVRVFASNKGTKANPIQGTYIYLYKLKHLGYDAHEILVVASKPEESEEETGGTARPVILRIYELGKAYSMIEAKKIAEEYLALTRLNYWNLRTGASRLALPVKMADILSYMLSMGIPIRVK